MSGVLCVLCHIVNVNFQVQAQQHTRNGSRRGTILCCNTRCQHRIARRYCSNKINNLHLVQVRQCPDAAEATDQKHDCRQGDMNQEADKPKISLIRRVQVICGAAHHIRDVLALVQDRV